MADYETCEELKKIKYDNITAKMKTNFFHLLILHVKDWATESYKVLDIFGSDYRLDKFDSITSAAEQFNSGISINIQYSIRLTHINFCLLKIERQV